MSDYTTITVKKDTYKMLKKLSVQLNKPLTTVVEITTLNYMRPKSKTILEETREIMKDFKPNIKKKYTLKEILDDDSYYEEKFSWYKRMKKDDNS